MNITNDKVPALSRIDLNLFRVFATIYREKNLTRASEQLFLSQSAISHALARLREHLNDPLFIRDGHGVSATPLAKRLWPDIEQALLLLQQAIQRAYSFDATRDLKHLTLAMNDEIEPVLLPRIAQWFDQHIPNVCLKSVRIDRKTLRQDLSSGRIDLAIDIAHHTETGIAHQVLLQDKFVVMRSNSASALTTVELTAENYIHAEHIVVSARPTGRTVEDISFTKQGVERNIKIRCQQYEAASRIAANSHLLLTIPQSLAYYLREHLQIEILPLPIAIEGIELHLYWNDARSFEPQTIWFKEQLISIFHELKL